MTRHAIPLLAAGALLWGCSSATKCSVPRDCPSTQRCVGGECTDPGGSPPSALGEACRGDADCAAGLTCQTAADGFAGGYCTALCSGSAPCASGTCTTIATAGLCTPACASDSACRQGYGCCSMLGSVCVPVAACTCDRPVVSSVLPAPQVQHIGLFKVGTEVPFDVPANTDSLTIVQQAELATLSIVFQGALADNSAVPLRIKMPDGGVVYDDSTYNPPHSWDGGVDSSGDYAFYAGSTPSTAAFTLPNTSASLAAGLPAGTWHFTVNDYANECTFLSGCSDGGTVENTYDVSVVTRPALAASPTLEVAFYIVTTAFSEMTAATNASVQRMVSTYKQIYAQGGITVNATFIDFSAADKTQYGTTISATATSPCDDLSQMFVLSKNRTRLSDGAALPPNTMNVFLVQALQDTSGGAGGTIVGIDGTIPGPASYNGTVQSGAVVSAADLFSVRGTGCRPGIIDVGNCGADEVAYIAAHETGHFLGLVHTTEQNGDQFDPIADTAKCPCFNCSSTIDRPKCGTSNPPFVQAHQCVAPASGCGGGDNLMFWFLEPGYSAGVISTQQAQLMKLSPLVH